MKARGSVARNFLALGGGEALSRITAFGTLIYIARALGAKGYGLCVFAVGVNLYLSKLADYAIEVEGSRAVAADPDNAQQLAGAVLTVRVLFAALVVFASAGVVWQLVGEPDRSLMPLYFLTLLPLAANPKWVLLGLERTGAIAVTRLMGEVVVLGVALLFVRHEADLLRVPLAQLAGDGVVCVALFVVLAVNGLKILPRWDLKMALPIFKSATPLVVQALLGLVTYNADILFLRAFKGEVSVGHYGAAYTLISFLGSLAAAYGMTLIPALTRLQDRPEEEQGLFHTALAQAYAVSLPIAMGGMFLAHQIIPMFFGDHYDPSRETLALLVWSVPFTSMWMVVWAGMIARGRQRLLTGVTGFMVVLNCTLNYFLIGPFSLLGAAAATVVTLVIGVAVLMLSAERAGLRLISMVRFVKPTIATAAMGLVLAELPGTYLVVALLAGISTYSVVLLLLGGIQLRGRIPVLRV